MNITLPGIVRVLADRSEPSRLKWHLPGDGDKPLSPIIIFEGTYASEDDARADSEAELARYKGAYG